MAKLKRFSFSSKTKSLQGDAAVAVAGGSAAVDGSVAAAASATRSFWLGGGPPLIIDDHIGREGAADAADTEAGAEDSEEVNMRWNGEEEGKGMYVFEPSQANSLYVLI